MPVYVMLEVLWSLPMLARWAKIMGPGQPRSALAPPDLLISQKVIWDPSDREQSKPSTQTSVSGIAPPASLPSTQPGDTLNGKTQNEDSRAANSFVSRLASFPPPVSDPSQLAVSEVHDAANTGVPQAILTLRTRLTQKPGLNIDIIGILATLAQRCEEAHQELMRTSPDDSWQNDHWSMCSKKVLIARAKLEKWADIVASGGDLSEQAKAGSKVNHKGEGLGVEVVGQSPDQRLPASAPGTNLVQPISPPKQENEGLANPHKGFENADDEHSMSDAMSDPYQHGTVWMDDMFNSLDPSLWLNDVGDWTAYDTTMSVI